MNAVWIGLRFRIVLLIVLGLLVATVGFGQSRIDAYSKFFLWDVPIAGERTTAIRYGNWYGPGWWGGSEDPKRCGVLPPIDALDKVAQKHDFGYQVAEELGKHHPEIVAYYKAVADGIAIRDAMALPSNPALWSPPAKNTALARRYRDRIAVGFKDFQKKWNALLAAKPTKGLDPTDPVEMEMILAGKLTEKEFEARAMALVSSWEKTYQKHLRDKAAKAKPITPPKKVDPGVKTGSRWNQTSGSVWSDNPNIEEVIAGYASGPYKVTGTITTTSSIHRWINPNRPGSPTTALGITWNAPPASLKPGSEIVITANADDRGSSSGAAEGDFVSFEIALLGSNDGKNWSHVSTGGQALYANPHKKETRTYRLNVPTTAYNQLILQITTKNTSWGKYVMFIYKWAP